MTKSRGTNITSCGTFMSANLLCQLVVLHGGRHLNTPAALCMMLARKDKHLSSARKRLMSQLGKRKGRTRNIEEHSIQDQQETVPGSQTTFLDINYQTTSEEIASSGDRISMVVYSTVTNTSLV